jgi:hypothetical protein
MNTLRTLTHMKKAIFTAIAVASLAILPATAQAVPITGTIDLVGAVRITSNGIDWLTGGSTPGGTTGDAIVTASSGYFDPLNFGDDALELDFAGVPIGVGGQNISGFETFEDMPGVNFTLDTILACGQTSLNPAVECILGPNSMFTFNQDTKGTTVVINFSGFVTDSNNPDPLAMGTFAAKFNATFLNQTPIQILTAFQQQGFIDAPYSAQKAVVDVPNNTEVPEPATMLTFGAGTALLAAHRRRRAKNATK